jgi:hypothetical protein
MPSVEQPASKLCQLLQTVIMLSTTWSDDFTCCVCKCALSFLQIKGMQVTTGAYLSLLEVRNFKAVTTHKVIVSK